MRKAQDDEAMMLLRWIRASICKANVESDERSALAPDQGSEVWILRPAYTLLSDRIGVVASRANPCNFDGEILVNLEPHGRA